MMKPFRERNPVVVGAISLVVLDTGIVEPAGSRRVSPTSCVSEM